MKLHQECKCFYSLERREDPKTLGHFIGVMITTNTMVLSLYPNIDIKGTLGITALTG